MVRCRTRLSALLLRPAPVSHWAWIVDAAAAASQASHYGVEIAATRLGSISDAVALLWAYRSMRVRPGACALAPADAATQALLQRAVLKHPKLRTPRQQAMTAYPGTRPYSAFGNISSQ